MVSQNLASFNEPEVCSLLEIEPSDGFTKLLNRPDYLKIHKLSSQTSRFDSCTRSAVYICRFQMQMDQRRATSSLQDTNMLFQCSVQTRSVHFHVSEFRKNLNGLVDIAFAAFAE